MIGDGSRARAFRRDDEHDCDRHNPREDPGPSDGVIESSEPCPHVVVELGGARRIRRKVVDHPQSLPVGA
jgi:hypothetical protein